MSHRLIWACALAQVAALHRRPHIVIATPGRLLDLLDASEVDLGATLCCVNLSNAIPLCL